MNEWRKEQQWKRDKMELKNTTVRAANVMMQKADEVHADLKADVKENTVLTIVGNDIKTNIEKNQEAISKLNDRVDKKVK